MYRTYFIVVGLILYGSLYPWHFEWSQPSPSRLALLLHGWRYGLHPLLHRDILVNVALYMPLGATGYLAFRRHVSPVLSVGGAVLAGVCLSVCVETLQIFQPVRIASVVDVLSNSAGSAVGVGVGLALAHRRHHGIQDTVATAMLVVWVAWLLFPFVPVLSRSALEYKLKVFLASGSLDALRFFTSAVVWLSAGRLLAAEGLRRPFLWLSVSLLLVPAQLLIANRQPVPSDLIGAAAGVALFAFVSGRTAAGLLLACIALRGSAPFSWTGKQPMSWIPFASLLSANWQRASLVLVEKCFFYGASIWSLHSAGLRLRRATALVCALLAIIEALQMHLPGRTPETTDPVVALLLAVAFSARSGPDER